jgi:phospholipase/carboxylesterase
LVVVAVHGRDQSPAYLVDHLIEPLNRSETARHDVAWILPAADGNRWYPKSFMAARADNEPWLSHALDTMAAIEHELVQPIVWAGFSQGASLVAEHVARPRAKRPAGLICLTGALIGPPDLVLNVAGPVADMPAYFSNSEVDEWVPLSRTEATAEAFRAAGAEVQLQVIPGRPHEISATEIDSVARFLRHVAS